MPSRYAIDTSNAAYELAGERYDYRYAAEFDPNTGLIFAYNAALGCYHGILPAIQLKGGTMMHGARQLYRYDLRIGKHTFIADLGNPPCALRHTCDNYCNAWVMECVSGFDVYANLYAMDKQTGEMTVVGNSRCYLLFGQVLNYNNFTSESIFFHCFAEQEFDMHRVDIETGATTNIYDLVNHCHGVFELAEEGFVFNDLEVNVIEAVSTKMELPLGKTDLNVTVTADGVSVSDEIAVTDLVYPEYDERPIAYALSDIWEIAKMGRSLIEYPENTDGQVADASYEGIAPNADRSICC